MPSQKVRKLMNCRTNIRRNCWLMIKMMILLQIFKNEIDDAFAVDSPVQKK